MVRGVQNLRTKAMPPQLKAQVRRAFSRARNRSSAACVAREDSGPTGEFCGALTGNVMLTTLARCGRPKIGVGLGVSEAVDDMSSARANLGLSERHMETPSGGGPNLKMWAARAFGRFSRASGRASPPHPLPLRLGAGCAALLLAGAAQSRCAGEGAAAPGADAVVGGAPSTMMIFSGNANKELAAEIAAQLGTTLGSITVARFADGEVNCQVHDNVRGKDVFLIQPTCPPVNEHLMELLLMVSTMRRASAERITCVIPYYGYARQDRKMIARVPISAADVARLLEAMGVDRVVAVDLHCGQIQGFFGPRVPVDNLDAANVGVKYFASKGLVNPVVVSPDAGGVYR